MYKIFCYFQHLKLNFQIYGNSNKVNWEFYSQVLPIYEHTATLLITETKASKQKSILECYKVLFRYLNMFLKKVVILKLIYFYFRLDQTLYKAIQLSSPQTEFYRSLLQHISNQFYFHLACAVMKLTKNVIIFYLDMFTCDLSIQFILQFFQDNSVSWYTSNQLAAPLFLMSLAPPIDKQAFENISSKEFSAEQKSNVTLWELEGTRRIIESGFVLKAMIAKEDGNFIENIKLLCIKDWKTANYKVFFLSIS